MRFPENIECGDVLTVLEVRNLLQNVAVGVERPRPIDPTRRILAGVKDNLCVDKVPGGYSFVQGLAKCHVTGPSTRRLGHGFGAVRIHPMPLWTTLWTIAQAEAAGKKRAEAIARALSGLLLRGRCSSKRA